MRSNSYDGLSVTISNLKQVVGKEKNVIIKAEDPSTWQDAVDANSEVSLLAKVVYKQFKDLKSDYGSGRINLVRYKDYLKQLKELLTGDHKMTNPNLHAEEIAGEIKKYMN